MRKFLRALSFIFLYCSSVCQAKDCPEWFAAQDEIKGLKIVLCESFNDKRLLSDAQDYVFLVSQKNKTDQISVSIYSILDAQKKQMKLIYEQTDLGLELKSFKSFEKNTYVSFGDFTRSETFHFAILTQQETGQTLIMKKYHQNKLEPVGFEYQIDQQWISVPTFNFADHMSVVLEYDQIKGVASDETTTYYLKKAKYVRL